MINIQKINYHGWQNSYQLSNKSIKLIVTCDVGPRIIHFGFVGGENEFATYPDMLGKTDGDKFWVYGGHRFWVAPEHPVHTYLPDNNPVQFEGHEDFVRLIQQQEASTGLIKELDIALDWEKAVVQVTHRLINHSSQSVEVAPWALSVMAPGGVGIAPLPPRDTHPQTILPTGTIALWPYTDMSDPRWTWGQKLIMLRQDSSISRPQKVGFYAPDGWGAYARNGRLFVKQFDVDAEATYPDRNSPLEMFTNEEMLEVETLEPLVSLLPETAVTHRETWTLLDNIPQPKNEQDVINHLLPHIQTIKEARTPHFQGDLC